MDQEEINEQINPISFSSYDDSLNCSDETYEEEDEEAETHSCCDYKITENPFSIFSGKSLFHEDDKNEVSTLLSKETHQQINDTLEPNPFLSGARRDAVDWILRAAAYHSFSALTVLLAVHYLDRFMLLFDGFRRDRKPWITELAAVACLSLAAKVEETHVPLLLDLQVEETGKHFFEAKTVQRMEILLLSTLQWRMNPVTPLAFLHHISRYFGFNNPICLEFLRRCEFTLLSVVSDGRFALHPPSVMAAATASHVVDAVVAPNVASEYQNHLMEILKTDKDKLEACRELVNESVSVTRRSRSWSSKRKFGCVPGSPDNVIDITFSSNGSNDSSATAWSSSSSSSSCSSVTSSPEPSSKKSKNTAKAK